MAAIIQVTAWERVSLWRRVPCAFVRVGILLTILIVLSGLLGPPLSIYFAARWEARRVPGVKVTPQPLADYSVSDAPGATLSYFGYEFEVPWNAGFKKKAFGKNGLMQVEFESGQNVTFIVPGDQSGLLTEIAQDQSLGGKNLQVLFGDLMNRSAYDQYAALLSTTPSSIRAFGPRAEAARGLALLTIKAIAFTPSLETGVFSFELPDKHGFQIGDPGESRSVGLEVFDRRGHHVEIFCGTTKNSSRLTQPELNRVLKSLHAVSAEPSAEPPASTTASRN